MKTILYIIAGIFSGTLGGMGMGGGTLLIPALTLLLKTPQHAAQGANLLAFIPMSIIAVVIHLKNKLIERKALLPILISAIPTAIIGSLISLRMDAGRLRVWFGVFLVSLGVIGIINGIIEAKKKDKHAR